MHEANELELLQNKKVHSIVKAARIVFFEYGIIYGKLKDIAKEAHVGEATLYRYFQDKTALVQLVAYDYWYEKSKLYMDFYDTELDEDASGYDHIAQFLQIFKELYLNHKPFLKFMEDFDNYMVQTEQPGESGFEYLILAIKEQIKAIVCRGKNDGSIKVDVDQDEVYAFISQVMVSTTQKVAIRVGYLQSDENLDALKVLDNLISMFLASIKNKK